MTAGASARPINALLQPGHVFVGRYRVERLLAHGGFGSVYVAEQIETELRVALKVLLPQVLSSGGDAGEKFRLEARVAARIRSEHIVRVFDAGLDLVTRMPFLVMELLIGEDLQRYVERQGPLPPNEVATYIQQTARGLDRAHAYRNRQGELTPIVHCDLKPENLFRTQSDDGQPLIKILDFGIAKVLNETRRISQELKGTPLFMSYEQAGGGQITPQTDIWSLGLITFFLLTGKPYWNAAASDYAPLTRLFGEVLTLPLVPASQRAHERGLAVRLPSGFDDWFFRCVNRDPAKRFATAGQAATALSALLAFSSFSNAAISEPGSAVRVSSAIHAALGNDAQTSKGAGPAGSTPPASSRFRLYQLVVAVLVVIGAVAAWFVVRSGDQARASVSHQAALKEEKPEPMRNAEEAGDFDAGSISVVVAPVVAPAVPTISVGVSRVGKPMKPTRSTSGRSNGGRANTDDELMTDR